MRNGSLVAAVLALAVGAPASAFTLSVPPDADGAVHLTPDSRSGWTPTAEQRTKVIDVLRTYLEAIDTLRFADAYQLLTDRQKRSESLAAFTASESAFRAESGAATRWRVLQVTWASDPVQSAGPGVYAAIDVSGRFENIDRHCGYVILYQGPDGGPFAILRREANYLPKPKPGAPEPPPSKAEMDRAWAALSRYCPNYVPDDP
jgi:uncharacterized protein DUF4019